MRRYLTILLCALVLQTSAQSFESLKRSKGKTALYAAVENTLAGRMSIDECRQAMQNGSLTDPYNGKTPIYLVLDYLATHKKSECQMAEQVLDLFFSHKNFDVNMRYSSLMPPLAYLIRENYTFLNGKFSSSYISDEVLRKFIEAGAQVDTYNSDGSTLMSFAMDTRNEYLQSYFLQKGINLRHADEEGRDDIYKMIDDGNLALLKDVLQKGAVTLTFHSLKNDPKSFIRHRDMYDFLAQRFAKEVTTYDDIVLFRRKFDTAKGLVEQKYQRLAQNEIDAIKTFDDIVKVEERYPGLEIVLKRKYDYYHRDAQKVDAIYQSVVQSARANTVNLSDHSTIESIESLYSRHHYDPDQALPKCKELDVYYEVCRGLELHLFSSYWSNGRPPRYSDEGHASILNRGISNCSLSGTPFDSFFRFAKPKLMAKKDDLAGRLSSSYATYERVYAQYVSKRKQMIKAVENLTMQEVKDRFSYESDWSKGRFRDTDDNFTDHKSVYYKDDINFTISWRYKNKPDDDDYENYYFSIYDTTGKRYATTDEVKYVVYIQKKLERVKRDYPL